MKEKRKVEIKCPVCDSKHSYLLTIDDDPVFGLIINHKKPTITKKRYVLTCPVKNKKFVATISI